MPKSKNENKKKNIPANTSPSTDRLRLLPSEIRLCIYEYASKALTVHVRRKWRAFSSLLSLPSDQRYIKFCQKRGPNEDPLWSPSVENAFFIGMKVAKLIKFMIAYTTS